MEAVLHAAATYREAARQLSNCSTGRSVGGWGGVGEGTEVAAYNYGRVLSSGDHGQSEIVPVS